MGKDKYICPCFKVTKDDIKKAIEEGADSFKKVKKATHLAVCTHWYGICADTPFCDSCPLAMYKKHSDTDRNHISIFRSL